MILIANDDSWQINRLTAASILENNLNKTAYSGKFNKVRFDKAFIYENKQNYNKDSFKRIEYN